MNLKKRVSVFCVLAALVLMAPGLTAKSDPGLGLIGSWEVSDDATGTPFLFTASFGGTYLVSEPFVNSSMDHGAWKHVSGRDYVGKDVAFLYGPDGYVNRLQKVDVTFTVSKDKNSFTGTLDIKIYDLEGNVVDVYVTTITATRIQAE